MLELFAFHGFFDLRLQAKGDTEIDIHHTNEDLGITLGQAFREALKRVKSIKRFGYAYGLMEGTLVRVVVDISGRGFVNYMNYVIETIPPEKVYNLEYAKDFLEKFAQEARISINISIIQRSNDLHHLLEAIFKALGIALDKATQIDKRRSGTPSTKGLLDI